MKPLTTSIYDFENLIREGFLYVDKTTYLFQLIERPGHYFLSRPRRFGKSLLISTLKAIFLNRRDLFKGLAIDSLDYDWQAYPVIHLDMGSCQASNSEQLHEKLNLMLDEHAAAYGVELIGVAYKEDVDHVTSVLLDIADRNSHSLDEPAPVVIFKGFGESSLDFMLGVWFEKLDFPNVRATIMADIKKRFDEEGIEIPFPHRTLYTGSVTDPFPVKLVEMEKTHE